MSKKNSYRQILHSSSIIGGASVINVLIGLVRTKVVAMVLGPAGVGLIGLLQSLMMTTSTVAALGFGNVGTRQIAQAAGRGDDAEVAAARRALFWGTMGLALIGAGVFWQLRDVLAQKVLRDPAAASQLAWIALGVALSVAGGSQVALLNGLRRIGDLARLTIAAGLLSTILGVGALLWLKRDGLPLYVVAAPVTSFIIGHWFVRRLGRIAGPATPFAKLCRQWGAMARVGTAFMVSGLVLAMGQLAVRTLVHRELGAEALGQFQAAWAISMTYIGFILSAMGTDFYPRLTASIHDRKAVQRLVNDQTEVALLLAGPIFLMMLGLAPWVIRLLYSSEFDAAVIVFRWQIMGDLLKVASFPLGFIILASGSGTIFMITESFAIGVFVLVSWLGMPIFQVQATGIAFLTMYAAYLPLVYFSTNKWFQFSWERSVARLFVVLLAEMISVFLLAKWSEPGAAVLGSILSVVMIVLAASIIGSKTDLSGNLGRAICRIRKFLLKIGVIYK